MSEIQMNPKVDEFMSKAKKWQAELSKLREIVLDCQLTEEFKWGQPCYTSKGSNILIISGFKEHFALNFFKGALLKDKEGLLIKPGENTQASRQMRFTNGDEIEKMKSILKSYILEAIEVEKAGMDISYKDVSEYNIPEEFQIQLNEDPALKSAFEALTPGRQRYYLIYFSEPKQSKTRAARIEKYRQQILDGKGFNDCICGLSQKMPGCDGSHKTLKTT